MSIGLRSVRAAAALAATGALLLSGCASQDDTPSVDQAASSSTAAPTTGPSASAAGAADSASKPGSAPERSIPVENPPSELPPGDPGLDAPSVPDPGRPSGDRGHEDGHARTTVPAQAMLDVQTVGAVLEGSWASAPSGQPECLADAGAVATRQASFRSDAAVVVQTVATHTSLEAADRAVDRLGRQLAGCGWTGANDPRLGSSSTALSSPDGARTAVVMAAEGVTVTVVGDESATAHRGRWTSLLDLALGDSCAAAAHGCH